MIFPNTEKFLEVYKTNLIKYRTEQPEMYAWPIEELDAVFEKMRAAILRGSFNKDSSTFKATCKDLKIKHTYKDIECYIKGKL